MVLSKSLSKALRIYSEIEKLSNNFFLAKKGASEMRFFYLEALNN